MKRIKIRKIKKASAATAPVATVGVMPVGVSPAVQSVIANRPYSESWSNKYANYGSMLTVAPGGGIDTRAADAAIAGITMPSVTSAMSVPGISSSTSKSGYSPAVASVKAPVPDALTSWGTKDTKTGWITGVNPSVDLSHLPETQRELSVAPTGRIYGGNKRDVDYLATSMDPAAVAWRSRREAEGVVDVKAESGPYGNVPGYRFIQDASTQESSVKSIMKMPTLQVQAINAGKEAQSPGFMGEGLTIFGGSTGSTYGGATAEQLRSQAVKNMGEDIVLASERQMRKDKEVVPGLLSMKNIASNISGIVATNRARKSTRSGKPKKQLAKQKFPVVSVPGINLEIPGVKGITLGSKKKRK